MPFGCLLDTFRLGQHRLFRRGEMYDHDKLANFSLHRQLLTTTAVLPPPRHIVLDEAAAYTWSCATSSTTLPQGKRRFVKTARGDAERGRCARLPRRHPRAPYCGGEKMDAWHDRPPVSTGVCLLPSQRFQPQGRGGVHKAYSFFVLYTR